MVADPHGVPSSMHYAGVTQSAKSVEKMFAHKMFSKFRTVKQAFNMVGTHALVLDDAGTMALTRVDGAHVWFVAYGGACGHSLMKTARVP